MLGDLACAGHAYCLHEHQARRLEAARDLRLLPPAALGSYPRAIQWLSRAQGRRAGGAYCPSDDGVLAGRESSDASEQGPRRPLRVLGCQNHWGRHEHPQRESCTALLDGCLSYPQAWHRAGEYGYDGVPHLCGHPEKVPDFLVACGYLKQQLNPMR
jgi:hypothetical protein